MAVHAGHGLQFIEKTYELTVSGGVAVFDGKTRIGAVGVSGLPGEVDEQLARRAIEAAGLG
jgi:uncharacterized protein GlcG (DUF336 family)